MFIVALLEDTVVTHPHELSGDVATVVKRRISERLCNKVVPHLGFCISVYDLVEIGATYIIPGEGYGHTRVKFHMVVLRPFVGAIVEAKVKASSEKGLTLSIDFFDDIFIPTDKLPEPHKYEQAENVWYWEYADGEDVAKLYMDPGKIVRFRVVENIFKDVRPDLNATEAKQEQEKSYEIIGTMADHGLGCIQWWSQEEEKEGAEEQMEEDEE